MANQSKAACSDGKMRVIIIGAGVAGISLARQLADDHDVTLLEANEDYGGTWLPQKCYHNLETHGCRAAFDLPWGPPSVHDPLSHVHHLELFRTLGQWADEKELRKKMRFNTEVVGLRSLAGGVEVLARSRAAGEEETLQADMVLYTGTTAMPLMPDFAGQDRFEGAILAAKDVRSDVFERIIAQRKRVIVLGGSKAAQDTVWNFVQRGYNNVFWVFRRAYWGTNYEYTRQKYKYGSESGLQARLRLFLFCARYFQDTAYIGYQSPLTWLCMSILVWSKYLVSPFPDGLRLGDFHGGIFEPRRVEALRAVQHAGNTEIASLSGRTVTLKSGETVDADVIICATGAQNEKVAVGGAAPFLPHELDGEQLYRGLIVPSAPRILFMNPITLGNILKDAARVGGWLRSCYLPALGRLGDEQATELLEHGLAEQNAETRGVRSRSFNLWHSFDRPVPWMFHVNRELDSEARDPSLFVDRSPKVIAAPKHGWLRFGLAFAVPSAVLGALPGWLACGPRGGLAGALVGAPAGGLLGVWTFGNLWYPIKAGLYLLFADRSLKRKKSG